MTTTEKILSSSRHTQHSRHKQPLSTSNLRMRLVAPFHLLPKAIAVSASLLLLVGCIVRSSAPEVVVYAALDREFSLPILKDFEKETGIRVRTKFDTEAHKSVGLTTQLITESKSRTRCDLFWNNEILNTLRIDELDLLRPIAPTQKMAFPNDFRSDQDRWFGFAARARVLIVNTEIVPKDHMPDSIYSLTDPQWKGQLAIAKPLFGTTATHAVCLFENLGESQAKKFFQGIKENQVQIVSGNKQVAEGVATGRFAFGLTDTDDAIIQLEKGFSVAIVYPDSKPDQIGTLFIPNTIAVLKEGPNQEAAEKLADYLLTISVEQRLAKGRSAQIPLHRQHQVTDQDRIKGPSTIKSMEVDFQRAVTQWTQVRDYLRQF